MEEASIWWHGTAALRAVNNTRAQRLSRLAAAGAAWRLMGADMYTGMSALEEASPVVARGVALHKLLRALTMVPSLVSACANAPAHVDLIVWSLARSPIRPRVSP